MHVNVLDPGRNHTLGGTIFKIMVPPRVGVAGPHSRQHAAIALMASLRVGLEDLRTEEEKQKERELFAPTDTLNFPASYEAEVDKGRAGGARRPSAGTYYRKGLESWKGDGWAYFKTCFKINFPSSASPQYYLGRV